MNKLSIGYGNVAEILMKNGANVNFAGHEGKTPLHLAAERGNFIEFNK